MAGESTTILSSSIQRPPQKQMYCIQVDFFSRLNPLERQQTCTGSTGRKCMRAHAHTHTLSLSLALSLSPSGFLSHALLLPSLAGKAGSFAAKQLANGVPGSLGEQVEHKKLQPSLMPRMLQKPGEILILIQPLLAGTTCERCRR